MRFGEPVAERSYHMGMTHEQGEYLGHGVYVIPGLGSELTVSSRRLDLGWREARGQVPGTAVLWREGSFEVVARSEVGRGDRWPKLEQEGNMLLFADERLAVALPPPSRARLDSDRVVRDRSEHSRHHWWSAGGDCPLSDLRRRGHR